MLLLHRRALAAMSFAAGAALGLPATGAAQEETVRLSGQTVAVYNLAGEITLTPGSGSDVAIDVSLRGADASQLEVRAGPVDTRRSNWDTVEALRIVYPGDRILYEGLDGQTRLRVHDDGTFWGGRGDRGMREVEISDRGAGLRASANLAVRVPTGKRVLIVLGAGMIEATNVDGNLYLDTGSGGIRTAGTTGVLNLDTGSGDVVVDGAEGDINIDTGSGDVNVRSVRGPDLNIDTGSGNVTVDGVEAPELSIDTGSGDVEVLGARTGRVSVDTGSGDVTVVTVAGSASFNVDTGSGNVTISVPDGYAGHVRLETGSGNMRTDLPLTLIRKEDDEIQARIGDGGSAQIDIETGSGNITLQRS